MTDCFLRFDTLARIGGSVEVVTRSRCANESLCFVRFDIPQAGIGRVVLCAGDGFIIAAGASRSAVLSEVRQTHPATAVIVDAALELIERHGQPLPFDVVCRHSVGVSTAD